jgi:hypothetical protein
MNLMAHYSDRLMKGNNNYKIITDALDSGDFPGQLKGFLLEKISYESPLLGNEPQILGNVLNRPIVGLSPYVYSGKIWTDEEVRKVVQKYKISYIIFFPKISFTDEKPGHKFFEKMSKGLISEWLEPLFSGDGVLLYKVKNLKIQEEEVRG